MGIRHSLSEMPSKNVRVAFAISTGVTIQRNLQKISGKNITGSNAHAPIIDYLRGFMFRVNVVSGVGRVAGIRELSVSA
jgi:hypothetical protein